MKKEITPDLKDKIEKFIRSEEKSISLPMIPISGFDDMLQEIGFDEMEMEGDETNGWQVDFWYYFIHPEFGKFCLGGSLHYGDFNFSRC